MKKIGIIFSVIFISLVIISKSYSQPKTKVEIIGKPIEEKDKVRVQDISTAQQATEAVVPLSVEAEIKQKWDITVDKTEFEYKVNPFTGWSAQHNSYRVKITIQTNYATYTLYLKDVDSMVHRDQSGSIDGHIHVKYDISDNKNLKPSDYPVKSNEIPETPENRKLREFYQSGVTTCYLWIEFVEDIIATQTNGQKHSPEGYYSDEDGIILTLTPW
jgi:hypothetical protein